MSGIRTDTSMFFHSVGICSRKFNLQDISASLAAVCQVAPICLDSCLLAITVLLFGSSGTVLTLGSHLAHHLSLSVYMEVTEWPQKNYKRPQQSSKRLH